MAATTLVTMLLGACNKESSVASDESVTISEASTIAVPASAAGAVAAGITDSVYIVGACDRNENREEIDSASVPSSALSYLDANYEGYSFHEAYTVTDSAGSVTGYVVIIYFNDKPVAVKFSAAGAYEKVLEQREYGDLKGNGHHHGGRFQHRDGKHRDSLAISILPSAITGYFASNYPVDTLLKAFTNADSSVLVISKNNLIYANLFSSAGTFISRSELPSRHGEHTAVTEAALPAAITYYLDTTYPNYVFEKAFSESVNGTLKGFVVVIDANNTKYAIGFDAAGNFMASKAIH